MVVISISVGIIVSGLGLMGMKHADQAIEGLYKGSVTNSITLSESIGYLNQARTHLLFALHQHCPAGNK